MTAPAERTPAASIFSTVVPEPLDPGDHTLLIDGVEVATFNVPANAPAGLPASGGGGVGSGGNGLGVQPWLFVMAGLVLGVGVFLVARRRPSRQ